MNSVSSHPSCEQAGRFKDALDEYGYALAMFKYEIANVARDQEAAELGDLGRGLGSDDLRKINKARVPCLLNSAAAKLKLAAAAAGEEAAPPGVPPPTPGLQPVARGDASKAHLISALEDLSEALKSGPAAQVRAKAHFRAAQAHAGLENWREAWSAASLAQPLQASPRRCVAEPCQCPSPRRAWRGSCSLARPR